MAGLAKNGTAYLLVFLLALGARLVNLIFSDFSPDAMLLEDAAQYWSEATIGTGFRDVLDHVLFGQTERMPVYILFVGAIVGLFGAHFLSVVVVQSVLDSFTCLMVMALGCRVYARGFWVFGVIAALWPNFIMHSASILTDTLFMFVFTWFLLAFVWLLEEKRMRRAVEAGLLLGLATLVRPVTQFMILAAPLLLPVLLLIVGANFRHAIKLGLSAFVIAGACIAPFMLKNVSQYDSFALTSQNGTHLQNWVAAEVVMLRDGVSRSQAVDQLSLKTNQRLAALSENRRDNPFVRSAAQSRTALEEIVASPVPVVVKSWLQGAVVNLAAPAVMIDKRIRDLPHLSVAADTKGSLVERLQQFVVGSSPLYVAVLMGGAGGAVFVSLLQFVGFFIQLRRTPVLASLGFLTLTYFILVNGPVGSPKYRLPMEPVLIVWLGCALLAVAGFLSKARHRRMLS